MAKKTKKNINPELIEERLETLEAKLELIGTKALEHKEAKEKLEKEVIELRRKTNSKAPSKSIAVTKVSIPKDIEVNTKDKYNTTPMNSATYMGIKNYRLFSKSALTETFKSKMFWVLLVVWAMLFTLFEFLFTANSYAAAYANGSKWNISNAEALVTSASLDMLNWFIVMPTLLLGLIIFPSFITQCREDNMLKRFTLAGMSRKQIYYNYMIYSTLFMIGYMIVFVGGWLYVMDKITELVFKSDPNFAANIGNFDSPWYLFHGVKVKEFFGLLVLFILAINSLGFKKSMKAKSSRSLFYWGIGMWIFVSIAQGTSMLMFFNVYEMLGLSGKDPFLPNSKVGNILIVILFFVLKYMFILSWPTLMIVGLESTTGIFDGIVNPITGGLGPSGIDGAYLVDNPQNIIYLLMLTTIVVALFLILSVFFKKKTIVSYEAAR